MKNVIILIVQTRQEWGYWAGLSVPQACLRLFSGF